MSEQDEKNKASVSAEDNSVAVGNISVGGNVGDIHIGNVTNVYNAAEDDVPLSSAEIENGLTRFAEYLPERAPVMADKFNATAKKLRATLGADLNALSPTLKTQREDNLNIAKLMCMEALDISFRALCLGDNPPPYDSRPPFLGLFAFHPEDREFFFGREALIQKLVKRIKGHSFLAVVGASGSGKSSLVMAGLIPALDAEMAYFTPSDSPMQQLQNALAGADANAVIVADQFEELFTLAARRDDQARMEFIAQLLELAQTRRVIVTLRADFWGEVAAYKNLKQEMQDHQELIAPMDAEELRAAMERQAEAVGLRFDPSLRETIFAEVKDEPGAMPLLQHALWMLWKRRHGLWLKAEEYQAFGGVRQAIASTAEDVYASCSAYERERVRDIFLRLTRLDFSEEGRDTRRRVPLGDLMPSQQDAAAMIALLDKLANARLIVKTVDGDQTEIEVAHEALIRHWERLRGWLNEDRDQLRLRESVTESAKEWEGAHKDEALLNHRGGRLEDALALKDNARYGLTALELSYLNACVKLRNRQQRERERRLRYTVMASIVAAIIFLVLGSYGWVKSNEATDQAATAQAASTLAFYNAATAQANANAAATAQANAEEQLNIALARQILNQAQSLDRYSTISELLAIQSMRLLPASEGEGARLLKGQTVFSVSGRIESVMPSPNGKYMFLGGNNETIRIWESEVTNEKMVHNDIVRSVAFSQDGKYVVSGSRDNTARVWEVATGKEVARMPHDDVSSVAFSPDGKYVAGSLDNTVRVWEAATGKEVARMTHDTSVSSVAFSPDGKYVVSGSFRTARVWEAASGKEVARMVHDNAVYSVAFSPDGKYVVSGDNTARVWEAATGKEVARMTHGHYVTSVAFSPDGKYVVSGSNDYTARVWEAATGKEVARMTTDLSVSSVAFSPDSKYVVSGSNDRTARVWEAVTGKEVARMMHGFFVTSVAFSPDGKYVVSGSDDKTARVWEAATGKEVARMTHDSFVTSVAFSPDGKYVVSGSQDNTARVWETAKGEEPFISIDYAARSVAFSPDGKYVVSGSDDKTARVWEVATGKEVARMTHDDSVESVALSPDGKYVVSGSNDYTARVWEAATGKEVARMTHDDSVESVAFSPDGKYVVSGSQDRTARVWEAATGKEVARMTHDSYEISVAFSPDGKYVVSGSRDNTARVWEVATGKEMARMTHDDPVESVAFSPDGKYVVSGSWNDTARVWEAATGKEMARMTHDDSVTSGTSYDDSVVSVAFSPDGKYVVSGSNKESQMWLWQPKDLITQACLRITRNLTRAEWQLYIGDALPYQAVCPNLPIESEVTSTPIPTSTP
jgi:uncharacterized delta-60 repeat protein